MGLMTDGREQVYRWLRHCLLAPDVCFTPLPEGDEDAAATDSHKAGLKHSKTVPQQRTEPTTTRSQPNLVGIKPLERFHTGILFPALQGSHGLDADEQSVIEDEDEPSVPGEEDRAEKVEELTRFKPRFVPPSSVGFSFFITGQSVRIQAIPQAIRYEPTDDKTEVGRLDEWHPMPLGQRDADAQVFYPPTKRHQEDSGRSVLENRAEVRVRWRPLRDGWLVTVSLSNTQREEAKPDVPQQATERNRRALFQVELVCVIDDGQVGMYPRVDYSLLDEEEQELEFRYRHHQIYAVGHGAAVDWQVRDQDGRVSIIRTDFLPRVEVPQVSTDGQAADETILKMDTLAGIEQAPAECIRRLRQFVDGYVQWFEARQAEAQTLRAAEEQATARRILARMHEAQARMQGGVDLLTGDALACRAFALANEAMASQLRKSKPGHPAWRPFQLAFLLLTITPTIDDGHEARDTLDLIWFPTGGGKTEAYLGLLAFLICWRRLKFPDSGGGTVALMRYTLRLLTKDQFRRAARLICALELLRQRYHDLGTEPISIGLWVGGSVSPNRFDEAERARAEALRRTDDEGQIAPPSLLVLEQCPWCGTPFRSPENLDTGAEHFRFRCLHPGCEFGATPERTLPCQVVDEALYRQPPTLLLATVDKFARLAWEERATVFFGTPPNRPPELIIQDELHLIAGALGSVAGLYEAALETVLTLRGVHPKYIASTATIRMAADQVRRLFGRDAAVFPPPGLDSEDSYFARTVPLRERPGRLYVGYLAPARARQHCLAPLAGALLGAPEVLFEAAPAADRQTLRDAWWTVLVYHGSLKGISVSLNAQQDIETVWGRLQVEVQQARTHGSAAGGQTGLPPWERRNNLRERTTQMTSQMSADDNARSFERLGKSCDHVEALDLALATNMISVGLDVGRLAVMVVNGQPLTTAEYIQASSRVGRGEVPGIVVANYYRSQARSLSHYEDFRAYHESFYRFVEPTSITPYTWQARKRALHAALVIVVRHGCLDLAANDKAGAFDPARPELAKAIQALTLRCRRADPGRGAETGAHLAELVNQWHDLAKAAPTRPARLVYTCARGIHNDLCLLCSHDDEVQGLWPTLNSMRNVEHTALVRIL